MMNSDFKLIRSDRKTISVSVKDGEIIVRAPRRATMQEIRSFTEHNKKWIEKHLEEDLKDSRMAEKYGLFTEADIKSLVKAAKKVIPERVQYYAEIIGVDYGRITIRTQKSRWGSCTATGNLNFNCLLMMAPPDVMDSVIVHELCHRKHMNHSESFYREVIKVFPEYYECHKWLKENGAVLMKRLGG